MNRLKSEYRIAQIWSGIFTNECIVEVDGTYKSWYFPFFYGSKVLLIDDTTFREIIK